MLFRLHKLALRLQPLLPWCYVLVVGSVLLAAFTLFSDGATPSMQLAVFLALTLWALLLFAFIRLFQSIPPPVLPKDSLFVRLWSRTKLALYHLLALGVLAVGLLLISLSLKLWSVTVS